METQFKVGDRILTKKMIEGKEGTQNQKGTIVNISYDHCGIEFDNPVGSHTCDGKAKRGYGYNLWKKPNQYLEYFELIETDQSYEIY